MKKFKIDVYGRYTNGFVVSTIVEAEDENTAWDVAMERAKKEVDGTDEWEFDEVTVQEMRNEPK